MANSIVDDDPLSKFCIKDFQIKFDLDTLKHVQSRFRILLPDSVTVHFMLTELATQNTSIADELQDALEARIAHHCQNLVVSLFGFVISTMHRASKSIKSSLSLTCLPVKSSSKRPGNFC